MKRNPLRDGEVVGNEFLTKQQIKLPSQTQIANLTANILLAPEADLCVTNWSQVCSYFHQGAHSDTALQKILSFQGVQNVRQTETDTHTVVIPEGD
jgi:hypothetical protein